MEGNMKFGAVPLAPLGHSYQREIEKLVADYEAQKAKADLEVNHRTLPSVHHEVDRCKHLADAMRYVQSQQAPPQVQIVEKPISDLKTADMIMELLGRGYAVIKMPEGGGVPDVLK